MPSPPPSTASNRYRQAQFLIGARRAHQFPPDIGAEVAIAGRSNAGKSSAINALTQLKALARVSKTPGRTQEINFFTLDEMRRLVDLPGYGYAKVPDSVRAEWRQGLESYLFERRSLRGLVLVMDIRHPLTGHDLQLLEVCHHRHLPVHMLLTKADKLSRGAASTTLHQVRDAISELDACTAQLFSATKRTGVDTAHRVLDAWLETEPGG